MSYDVDSSSISRNERPLRWTYTEGISVMKSKYNTSVFKKAAQVFASVMHHDDDDDDELQKRWSMYRVEGKKEMPDFDDLEEKRKVLELVFGTLLYDKIYRTVLDNRSFFFHYPELQKLCHLTIVVLHDMQSRKLLPGICDCEIYPDPNVQDVENALLNFRLKIGAEVAKIRIENHAPTFHQLRPSEFLRFPDPCVSNVTLWGWVNETKRSMPRIIKKLQNSGLRADQVKSISDVSLELTDVFSIRLNDPYDLLNHPTVKHRKFIVQDASCCIAPQCLVNTLLHQCRVALGQEYISPQDRRVSMLLYIPCAPLYPALGPWDVAISDVGNGLTAAHLASLLDSFGFRGRVLAFGGGSGEEKLDIPDCETGMCVPGVQVVKKSMTDFSPEDDIFRRVRAVLVQPKCTRSAVVDPINFLCSEGGVTSFLHGLYEKRNDHEELYQSQMKLLKFCMKLPKVQVIVYVTHSTNQKENQDIVEGAVEDINAIAEPSICSPDQVNPTSNPADEVKCEGVPQVIRISTVFEVSPVPVNAEGYILNKSRSSPYIRIKPENGRNGCFIAAITRKEIPESFKPEADDCETDLALLFKDPDGNYSNSMRALQPQCEEGTNSLEDSDLENESTQEQYDSNDSEFIKGILILEDTLKNERKTDSEKRSKGKKKLNRKRTGETASARNKVNSSLKGSQHRTCFSATPSKERPKSNSRQSERIPTRVTYSRLSRSSSKKQGTSMAKLEALTLNHFVGGKSQTLDPKFREFLDSLDKSRNQPKTAEEPAKTKDKQKSNPKRGSSRRRKRSGSTCSKRKSEKLPFSLSERTSSAKPKKQMSGPFSIKTVKDPEMIQPPSEPERIYDPQDSLSDFSDDDTEESWDEFTTTPRPSWKLKPLGQRRRRYERHQRLYLDSRKKEDLDDVLSDMLLCPEVKTKSRKWRGTSPLPATQWTGKMTEVCEQSRSAFNGPWNIKSGEERGGGGKAFDVYLPEAEIPRLRESINMVPGTTSGGNPNTDSNLEDINKVQSWIMENYCFKGTRPRKATLFVNKKPVSFRNAAHVVTPELRLPPSHKPEFQYQKEDHICLPQKRLIQNP